MKRHIQPAVKDPRGGARSYEGWQCYQALVSAVGGAMYDLLVARASERLPYAHLLVGRRTAVPAAALAAAAARQRRRGGGGGGGGMEPRVAALLLVTPAGRVRLELRLVLPGQGKVVRLGEQAPGAGGGEAMEVDAPSTSAGAAGAAQAQAPATPQQQAAAGPAARGGGGGGGGPGAEPEARRLTAAALLGAPPGRAAEAMVRAALAGAWRDDADVGLTLAALAQLFGEPFLALLPSSVLPGAVI
jgi:hypothetical protein